jgi:hypothetical protein
MILLVVLAIIAFVEVIWTINIVPLVFGLFFVVVSYTGKMEHTIAFELDSIGVRGFNELVAFVACIFPLVLF